MAQRGLNARSEPDPQTRWLLHALDPAVGTVTEEPLLIAIMPRVCVDKQTGTTVATKKSVDK
jgi:hypothetical protein